MVSLFYILSLCLSDLANGQFCTLISKPTSSTFSIFQLQLTALKNSEIILKDFPNDFTVRKFSTQSTSLQANQSILFEFYFTSAGEFPIIIKCNNQEFNVLALIKGLSYSKEFIKEKPSNIGDFFDFHIRFNISRPKDLKFSCFLDVTQEINKEKNGLLIGSKESEMLNNDSCSFFNLRVDQSGSYFLVINVLISYNSNQTSEIVDKNETLFINSSIQNIEINENIFVINEKTKVILKAFGKNKMKYLEKFYLEVKDSQKLFGLSDEKIIVIGELVLEANPENLGKFSVEFTATEMKNDKKTFKQNFDFTVKPGKIEVIIDSESDSKVPINFSIQLKNMSEILKIDSSKKPLMIFIQLIEANQTSGKTIKVNSVDYKNGSFEFPLTMNPYRLENFLILSSGVFKFKVKTGDDFKDETSSSITSKNYLKSFELSITEEIIFNYLLFSMNILFLGEDQQPFLLPCSLEIIEKSTLGLLGTLKPSSLEGKFQIHDLMFLGHGDASLEIISEVNKETIHLKVLKNSLKLDFPLSLPKTSETFTVIAEPFNNSYVKNNIHPLSVNLKLIPVENCSGAILTGNLSETAKGPVFFKNLKILSSGWFKLEASSENLTSFTTTEKFFIKNKVLRAEVFPSEINSTVFEDFNISVSLLGEDNEKYLIKSDINQTTSSDFWVKNVFFIENEKNRLILTLVPQNAGAFSIGVLVADPAVDYSSQEISLKVSRAYIKPNFKDLKIFSENKFSLDFQVTKDLQDIFPLPQANNFHVVLKLNCINNNSFPSCESFSYEGEKKVECFNGFLRFDNLVVNQASIFSVALQPGREETFDFNLNYSLEATTNIQFNLEISSNLQNLSEVDSKRNFDLVVFSSKFGVRLKNVSFKLSFTENMSKNIRASGLKINKDLSGIFTTGNDGSFQLKDIKISSSGFFIFSLFYSDQPAVRYETHFFRNFIKKIDIEFPENVFVNYPFEIFYKLTGDDDQPYLLDAKINIYERTSGLIRGNTLIFSYSPSGSFFISLGLNKNYYLELNSDKSSEKKQFQIKCFSNFLKVWSSFDDLEVVSDSTLLVVEGFVYGDDPDHKETYFGSYLLTFSDTLNKAFSLPSKVLQGHLNETFMIKNPGTYNLTILTGPELRCNYSKLIKVVSSLKYISINESSLSWPMLTLIEITADLISYNEELFHLKSLVHLSCSDNSGLLNNSIWTSTGQVKFYLFFNSPGFFPCFFESWNKTKTFTFEIRKDRELSDDECFLQLSPTTCYKCVSNSRPDLEGNCECSSNSEFDPLSKTCVCLPGFKAVQNFCLTCGYFYHPSEISAEYSPDFRSIQIDFASPADISLGQIDKKKIKNNDVFELPRNLVEFVKSAEWISNKKFLIKFSQPVNGNNGSLILNPSFFQKVPFGECDEQVKDLNVELRASGKPFPEFSIVYPGQVSKVCGLDLIKVSSFPFNPRFVYSWSSSDFGLEEIVKNWTSAEIDLMIQDLPQPLASLTLTVTDTVFNTSHSKSISIDVLPKKILTISFPQGDSVIYKTSENLILKSQIINSCSEIGFQYKWTMKNLALNEDFYSPPGKFKSQYPNMLILNKTSLDINNSYLFQVEINSANNVQGSAKIQVQVFSASLELTLNRASGNVSTFHPFDLKAQVNDPDEPLFKNFTFLWKGFDRDGKECLGSDLKPLIRDNFKEFIHVEEKRIRNNSFCSFRVEVRRDEPFKESKDEVMVFFSEGARGEIVLAQVPEVVNGQESLILTPYLFLDGEKEISWMVNPKPLKNLETNKEYLSIPKGSLKPGENYIISLSLKSPSSPEESAVSTSISIYINTPPTCQKFLTTESSKGKVHYSGLNCQDQDSDSFLFYQFGFIQNSSEVWLTKQVPFSSLNLRIPEEAQQLAMKVCDSNQGCKTFTSIYVKSQKNERFLSVTLQDFEEDIEDVDETPAAVVFFSKFIKNTTDVDFLFEKLKIYFLSVQIEDFTVDSFFTCLESVFVGRLNKTEFKLALSKNVNEFMKKILKGYQKQLNSENFKKFVKVFGFLSYYLDEKSIDQSFKFFSDFVMKNLLVNDKVVDFSAGFARFRVDRDSLFSERWESGGMDVIFPGDLNVERKNYVYDFIMHSYQKEFPVFDVTIKQVGDLSNGLSLFDSSTTQEVSVNSSEGIKINLKGTFDISKKYECKYLNSSNSWTESGCKIINQTETQITLLVSHFSIYSIQEYTSLYICSEGFIPLIIMGVLILLLVLSLYTLTINIKNDNIIMDKDIFWYVHPVTALYFDKRIEHKSLIVIQIVTNQIVLIALIGAFQLYFNSADDKNETSSDEFNFSQTKAGFAGFFLSQVVALPIFILNTYNVMIRKFIYSNNNLKDFECDDQPQRIQYYNKKIDKYKNIEIFICGFFIIASIIGIFIMTVSYCEVWSTFWVYNWIIFTISDFFTFKINYALIFREYNKTKLVRLQNENLESIHPYQHNQ